MLTIVDDVEVYGPAIEDDGEVIAACQDIEDAAHIVKCVNQHEALVASLEQAIDESGYSLSGPTDWRVAENGEPKWVCNARATIAAAKGGA